MRIVLDTNILLTSFSDRSATHWVVDALKNKIFELAYTTEILAEYEEKFGEHWNENMAKTVITTILELPNTVPITVYYQLNLVKNDEDDNKFADCAFASNATYLVSNDTDFAVLKTIDFPVIRVLSLQEFEKVLLDKNLLNHEKLSPP